jgi:hypothetical protein
VIETSDVLQQVFPNECMAVGPAVVDRIAQGQPMTAPAEGRRMDLTLLMQLLSGAVSFINGVIVLWKHVKAAKGRKPSKQELLDAVRENPPTAGGLTQAQQDEIIETVAQKAD